MSMEDQNMHIIYTKNRYNQTKMKTQHTRTDEGLMHYYFGHDTYVTGILETMQQGISENKLIRIPNDHIEAAKLEAQLKGKTLDVSTYPFAYDLSTYDYRGNVRVVMLIDGTLKGIHGYMDTVIPIDIGNNPYELFRGIKGGSRGRTIDLDVTAEQLQMWLNSHKDALLGEGFTSLHVDRSLFFYLRRCYIKGFLQAHDRFDAVRLARLVYPAKGYVGLERVEKPTIDEYMEHAPLFRSYRLKKSLARKILRRFEDNDDREIKDWVAHRIVVGSIDDVRGLAAFLKSSPTIGNSYIRYIRADDYYRDPKESGFKAMNVVAEVTTKGERPCVREIQIVDKEQYYRNEFVEEERNRVSHEAHERQQAHRPKRIRDIHDKYKAVLEEVFGVGGLEIEIL